jgi:hypothetical protein
MTSKELRGWSQYFALEPDNSVEIQLALLAQIVNNALGGKLKIKDALITRQETTNKEMPTAPTSDQIKSVFSAIASL